MSVLCIACQREVFGHSHASFCDYVTDDSITGIFLAQN